jgi:sortase (surface protein transpeptidase)
MFRRSIILRALVAAALVLIASLSIVRASSPVTVVPAGWPKLLSIPRLHVTAAVEDLALTKVADDKAPYKWGDVGWYNRGPRPGDLGRATIFGHLDSYCCPAVFYQLRQMKAGDKIGIAYKNHQTLNFRVMWQKTYLNAKLPFDWIYGHVNERGLVLMTCAGVFHPGTGGGYDHKLVVYARLILPSGELG